MTLQILDFCTTKKSAERLFFEIYPRIVTCALQVCYRVKVGVFFQVW